MTLKQNVIHHIPILESNQKPFANKLMLCTPLVGITLRGKKEREKEKFLQRGEKRWENRCAH